MPTKALNIDQHQPLHLLYPNDCCLCKAEAKIQKYENLLRIAKGFVIDARGSWETQQGDFLVEEIEKLNLGVK